MAKQNSKYIKILIVATLGRFLNFERNNIKLYQTIGYEVHCATNMQVDENDSITDIDVIKHQIDFFRSPLSVSNIRAFRQLRMLLENEHFDLVHCHTPVGGILTRLVAGKYRKIGTKIFYTAHGFHFYKGAPLINWIVYYTAEWFFSWWTDMLITINKEDYESAKKNLHAKKIVYVPGVGIDTDKFQSNASDRDLKRSELGLSDSDIMCLSVGELSERKNHKVTIKALAELKNTSIKYFICGTGRLEKSLRALIHEKKMEEQIFLLGYRSDISGLCKASDLFLFPSKQEGLPVSLMEAMSSELPCICSDIRGNKDLIVEGKGGYRVKSTDVNKWKKTIRKMLNDEGKRRDFGLYNRNISQKFSINVVQNKMNVILERYEWK